MTDSETTDREERMERALQNILGWCEAYPTDIFPKIDIDAARAKLGDDALFSKLHAEWARHLLSGIARNARFGLRLQERQP